jgi:lipoic acid synthetase
VVYLLLDLRRLRIGRARPVARIEDATIALLAAEGVPAARRAAPGRLRGRRAPARGRREDRVAGAEGEPRLQLHGVALNVAMDLEPSRGSSRAAIRGWRSRRGPGLASDASAVGRRLAQALAVGWASAPARQGYPRGLRRRVAQHARRAARRPLRLPAHCSDPMTASADSACPRRHGADSMKASAYDASVKQKGAAQDRAHPDQGGARASALRKPDWIRVRAASPGGRFHEIKQILREHRLHTVCEEASCPNIGECFGRGTATFMIMGDKCTRRCPFCDVGHGRPDPLDADEPANLARTIAALKLSYVVITSVDRDDLRDGGAKHFVDCIREVRAVSPDTRIEVLVPDFRGRLDRALEILEAAPPDVMNHNLETVPRLYREARPGSDYAHSLKLLPDSSGACRACRPSRG